MASIRARPRYGVYLTLAGAVLAVLWALVVLERYQRSWNALGAVELNDGRVIYEWQVDQDGRSLDFTQANAPSESILLLLLGADPRLDLGRIWGISFEGSNIDNGDLHLLKLFPNLRSLDLRNTKITDKGLQNMANVRSLELLSLRYTEVGDGAVPYLSKLPRLRYLDLYGSQITENGVTQLRKTATLKTILVPYPCPNNSISRTRSQDSGSTSRTPGHLRTSDGVTTSRTDNH